MNRFRKNPGFGRRALLRSLGVSAAVAPFLPILSSEAEETSAMPKRLIVFFHPHGTIRENWLPSGTVTDFSLPTILEPLAPFRDKMVVVDGLRVYPQGPLGGPHTIGPSFVFTGSRMQDGGEFDHGCCTPHGWNTHASIDQVVAQRIGKNTAFPSLEFGVRAGGQHPGSRLSYAAPGQPLAPENNPFNMFDRLFGDFQGDASAVAKRKSDRLSVLDVVRPELDALNGKVGSEDRAKIEAHLGAVHQLQDRLELAYTCTPTAPGEVFDPAHLDNTPQVSRLQLDLMVEAMACGLTNVASIMYKRGENDFEPYPWLGFSNSHHDLSHAGDSDTVARGNLTKIYQWYAGELAYLVQRLSEVHEADGSTMLDNTLIVWGSELATGNSHAWGPLPFVLMGGAGGSVRTGQFLQFPEANHCRLLTSICRAMGLDDVDSFGNLDDGTGVLDGLLA